MIESNYDENEINDEVYISYQYIQQSKYYILHNHKYKKIYIPNILDLENNITCKGYILDVNNGEYNPSSWIKSIQVISNDVIKRTQ